ncbi:glycoside hydrolase family 97 N-terminal domain-containing protein, partial [Bacteroides thetaiotaomicron]
TISCEDVILLENNRLQLELNNEVLGEHPHLQGQKKWNVKEMLNPVVPLKFSTIENEYSQLLLDFKGGYSLEFRAFNDGIAYRFIMKKRGNIE